MKKLILTLSILLVVIQLFGQESRFWVNGGGKWFEGNHWATESGGSPGATNPDASTNVVFDQNSFSEKGSVSVTKQVVVNNITANNARFAFSGKKDIIINGSVDIDENVDFGKFSGSLIFSGTNGGTINLPANLSCNVVFDGGEWSLSSNLTTKGNVYLKAGALKTNNNTITCAEFNGNSTTKAELNLGESDVVCDRWNFAQAENLTLDAMNANIMVRGNMLSGFATSSNLKYNAIGSYSTSKIGGLAADVDVTVKDVTCPANATNKVNDGEVTITVSVPGTYNLVITTNNVVNNVIVKQGTGDHIVFTGIAPGTYNAGYYVGDINDEGNFKCKTITVGQPQDFAGSIEVITDADCYREDIKRLEAVITGGTLPYSYTWNKAGESTPVSTSVGLDNVPFGSRLEVLVKDANGCEYKGQNGSLAFTYNGRHAGAPQAVKVGDIIADESCEGENTGKLTISASGGTGVFAEYKATKIADNSVYSSTTNNIISNLSAGAYNVVVTDSKGCVSSEKPVSVGEIPAPVANAGADASICKNSSYTLNGVATNHSAITWTTSGSGSFNDASVANPTYTPSSADEALGSVTLTMTVAGNGTCSASSDNMVLSFVNTPTPVVTSVDDDICGLTSTLSATASMGGALEWEMVSGAGQASFVGNAVTVTAAGVYTFRVKEIEPLAHCEGYSANSVTLTFFNQPTVSITTAPTSVCGTETLALTAVAANNNTLTWSTSGSGSFSSVTSANTIYTPSIADIGNNVTLTVTVGNGVCANVSATYVLKVNQVPAPINTTSATAICGFASTATATASLAGNLTWRCDEAGLTFASANSASTAINVTSAGTYNIYVEEEKDGCVGTSARIAVTFYEEPTVTITTGTDGFICGNSTQALAATSNCTNIQWTTSGTGSFSNSTSLNTVYTPSVGDAGKTIVLTLTAISNNPTVCTTPAVATYNLQVNPIPNPTIAAAFNFCGTTGTISANNVMAGSEVEWIVPTGFTISNSVVTGTTATANITMDPSQFGGGSSKMVAVELIERNNGCENEIPKYTNVTFHAEPSITLPLAQDVTCSAGGYALTATPTNCSTVIWEVDGGVGSGTFTPTTGTSTTFTPNMGSDDSRVFTIKAIGTPNASVCVAPETTMQLTVNRTPSPAIIANDINCGLDIDIQATNVRTGSSFDWDLVSATNSGTVVSHSSKNGQNNTIKVSGEGIYTFSLVETLNGCSSAPVNKQVTVYKAPEVYAGADATICADEPFYRIEDARVENSAPTTSPINWLSSSGSGTFLIESIMTPKYTPSDADKTAGSVTLTITTTHQYCGTATDAMVLTISPIPTPTITANDGVDICGRTTELTGIASQAGSLSWAKKSGAGDVTITPSTGANVTVVVSQQGTYEIELTETSADGCVGTKDITLKFTDEPSIDLSAYNDDICAGDNYELTANFSNCTSVVWSKDLAEGTLTTKSTTATSSVVEYQSVLSTSTKTVTITATPQGGCNGNGVKSMVLTINATPAPTLANDNVCGLVYTLPIVNTVAGSTLNWSCTDSNISFNATATEQTITAAAAGTYTITLEEVVGNCSGVATAQITFVEEPIVNAGQDDAVCADQATYTLTATAENYASLQWTTSGDGSFSNATALDPVYTFGANDVANGTVTLTLTANPNAPCTTPIVSTKTITINPLPIPTISGDDAVCLNSSAVYATEAGMSNYVWTIVGGSGTSTTNSITITWDTPGSGSVAVSYTNGNGCTAATPTVHNVTVNELPTIGLPANLTACTGSDLTIDAAPTGGLAPYVHAWSGDVDYLSATDVAVVTFNSDNVGIHSLTYTVTDANGCENSSQVIIDNLKGPSVFAGDDATLCYGSDYTIADATMEDAVSIKWTTSGDGIFDDPTALNPVYTPGSNDWANGSVVLTAEATSALCGSVTDDVELTLLPKLAVNIGTLQPFAISNTTKARVEIYGEHESGYDLGFYLVAPDGQEVKLYDHIEDIGTYDTDVDFIVTGGTFSPIAFSTESTNALNFDNIVGSDASGEFSITGDWSAIYGKNPAEGGWSVHVADNFGGAFGKINRIVISFTDINYRGEMQTVTFDSKTVDWNIDDHRITEYSIPLGLRTSCYGTCDASAVINVTGGTGIYNSFVWDDPSITRTDTVELCAGVYTLTVTDSYGCVASGSVEVLSPEEILLSTTTTDIACYGDSTGTASVTATNGIGLYTYLWNDVAASETKDVSKLPAGDYIVRVTDENNCWVEDTVTILQPDAELAVANIVVGASDCAVDNGTIEVVATGGVAPYVISCATATFVDNKAENLGVGFYTIHIEDANLCSIDTIVEIKTDASLAVTGVTTDVTCNGSDNGEIQVVVLGGSGNYEYTWSNGETTDFIENLAAGTYDVIVRDLDSGCEVAGTYEITQPEPILADIVFDNQASCDGNLDMLSFHAEVTGGVGKVNITWYKDGYELTGINNSVTNVEEGVYEVNVYDEKGCSVNNSITIVAPTPMAISTVATESECDTPTGTITTTVSGGNAPYSYYWYTRSSSDTVSTAENPINLGVDSYIVEVTDALGCAIYDTVEVMPKGGMFVNFNHDPGSLSCIQNCDGQAQVLFVRDGLGISYSEYKVYWNNDTVEANATNPNPLITGLCYGENRIVIEIPNGCKAVEYLEMTDDNALRVINVANYPDLNGGEYPNGEIEVTVAGGIGNYSYEWKNAVGETIGNKNRVSGLGVGDYTLTVTDENPLGCTLDTTITIEHRPMQWAEVEKKGVSCYNGNDGVLEVEGIGGYYEPYKYEWKDLDGNVVANTARAENLTPGKYIFIVSQHADRLSVTDTLEVVQPNKRLHIPITDYKVDGSDCYTNNGVITIFDNNNEAAFGGTAPFIYTLTKDAWTNTATSGAGVDTKIEGLGVGKYTVMVEDAEGCLYDTIFEVRDLSNFKLNENITALRCNNDNSGAIALTPTSKNGNNFKYAWAYTADTLGVATAIEDTINAIMGLAAGKYVVKVTDDSSCVKVDSFNLTQPSPIRFNVSQGAMADCANSTDGEVIFANMNGGTNTYRFYHFLDATGKTVAEIEKLVDTTTVTLTGVVAGDYQVYIADDRDCFSDTVKLKLNSKMPAITINGLKDLVEPNCGEYLASGELSLEGAFTVEAVFESVSSTVMPLFYSVDNGAAQNSSRFTGLRAGEHVIKVGFGDTLACAEVGKRTLEAKSNFAIEEIKFERNGKYLDSLYTCPDNELQAFVSANAQFSYKWYTSFVEEVEDDKPVANDTVVLPILPSDSTTNDTVATDTLAFNFNRFRGYYLRADSLATDSVTIDSTIVDTTTDTTKVVEPQKPVYEIDADGNVVLVKEKQAGFNATTALYEGKYDYFLPYGGRTYYYVKAISGACMDIDSVLAISMKPTNKLNARVAMEGKSSEELMRFGKYEVAEGAQLFLQANELTFDMLESYDYVNSYSWSHRALGVNAIGEVVYLTSPDTMPAQAQPYGNIMFKVRDSVRFNIDTLTCYYYDSVEVNTINGVKPADVFTPNGDGKNDVWEIAGITSYEKATIYVFNRWGGRVWQYDGSGFDYTANQWNGKNEKNKPLPSGTYYYVIQCSDGILGGKKITGPVTIIR